MGLFDFLKPKPKKSKPEKHSQNNKTAQNPYEGLRNMAFSATAERLGLNLPSNEVSIFGVIMDWEMGGAVASTVAYKTGDASLYLSTGGGVIGGGQHANVNLASKQFVEGSSQFLQLAHKTQTTELPSQSEIKFYFLTNQGVFCGTEEMKNFENGSSKFLPLFNEGNKVLSALRETQQNQ